MRTLTADELARCTATNATNVLTVEVEDADGTWQDWTARVVGCAWGEHRDDPVGSATIQLARDLGFASLAPYMEESTANVTALGAYGPALDMGRGVRIATATPAPGHQPASADFRYVFEGRVDDIQWEADPLVLTCSGTGAWLMDTQIREAADYGSDLGTAIETVLQDIVDDTPSGKVTPTIYTPASPSYLVTTFALEPEKVLTAARDVALRIGYDLRYRYDASDAYRLTFMDPDRDRATVDATLGPEAYYDIRALKLALAAIRNTGRCYYRDTTGAEQYVTYTNATSVADHGDRYFQIPPQEGIDTSTEAQALIDAAGHDLSGPGAEKVVVLRYFWPVQLYDRYTFEANGVHYDTDQTLSIAGYQHEWTAGGEFLTTLTGTARVVGAYREWRKRLSAAGDLTAGPSLVVTPSPGSVTYSLAYTGTGGVVELSVDGGAYSAAPASPISVTRPAAGSASKSYAFRVIGASQTVTNEVTVPALDKDTVTPDLNVAPSLPTTTTQSFTVTASNPAGGTAPAITVRLNGTTGTNSSTSAALSADTDYAVTSGQVILVNRPAFGTTTQASATFKATLSGAGSEIVQRTVLNQVKTTFGPTLTVTPTPGASTYSIAYTASGGTLELSIDGGAYATAPASPIAVTRPSAGSQSKSYAFRITADGQTIANEVTVPAIDQDTNTVTPDLTVSPYDEGDTFVQHQVTASNPSGGTPPTITVRLSGTTGSNSTSGAPFSADTTYTLASGDIIVAHRPAFDTTAQASLTVVATLSGGGQETIQRTVLNQVKTTFGPTLEVTPTPGSSSYSIAYSSTGTVTLSINGGAYSAPAASPIVVSRTSSDQVYVFKATLDGQTVTSEVTIPALVSTSTATRFISNVQVSGVDNGANTITVVWSAATNVQVGDVYDLVWVRGNYVASGEVLGVTSPYAHGSGGSGGHGLDLVNGGTVEPMHYVVRVRDSGGTVGQSGQISYDVDHL